MGFVGHDGRPAPAPEPPRRGPYDQLGDFQAAAYDRNAFASPTATAAEVDWMWPALDRPAGRLVVDVGCATGRHAAALAERGARVVGVDLSHGLLAAGRRRRDGWWPLRADAAALPLADGAVDAAVSWCQGGFGVTPDGDRLVIDELARVLRPGGRLVLSAYRLAFAARHLTPGDAIDLERGLHHHLAAVRDGDGHERRFPLWSSCWTAEGLTDRLETAGLRVLDCAAGEPGAPGRSPVDADEPELHVVARRR